MVIQSLIDGARTQSGQHAHFDPSGSVRAVTAKPAALVEHHLISTIELTAPTSTDAHFFHSALPRDNTAAGTSIKLPNYLAAESRTGAAGARFIVIPDDSHAYVSDGGALAFQQRTTRYDVITPANFAKTADGDELAVSSLPFLGAEVDLETIPSYGFQTVITRDDARQYADGLLSSAAMLSIAMGLARVVDAVLMNAIVAANPATFSLGAAAAAGFNFGDLRALVGNLGTGASVDALGVLRAGGVPADLTPVAAATVIGAFDRSAVAFSDRITFTGSRTNTNGDVELTCWCNAQALLPQPSAFWVAT